MKKIKINNKEVYFNIYNPGGNITALVINDNYNSIIKKKINDYILKEYKYVEQVGFISNNKLEMAGGEFCINALRCAIYYLSTINKNLEINILDKKIEGSINSKYVSINFEINKNINEIIKNNIVNLDGISLIFLDDKDNKKLIKDINKAYEVISKKIKNINIDSKAIGIVLIDKNSIYPFIWVKEIDTLYFETACGSASIAYALLKYKNTNKTRFVVKQPSGYDVEIKINLENEIIKNIIFKGYVEEYKERR